MLLHDPVFLNKIEQLVEQSRSCARGYGLVPANPSKELFSVRGLLQHGIHAERSAPDILRRLGNVAGDQLKSAGDLGVPVIGIGLLYQQGYFRQIIN